MPDDKKITVSSEPKESSSANKMDVAPAVSVQSVAPLTAVGSSGLFAATNENSLSVYPGNDALPGGHRSRAGSFSW